MRRASANHDSVEAMFLDVLFDQLLSQRRAHELVLFGDNHTFKGLTCPLGKRFNIDRSCDVAATVAYVNSNFFAH
jgi:hypothetical protein